MDRFLKPNGKTSLRSDGLFWLVIVLSLAALLLVLVEPVDFDTAIEKSFGLDLLRFGRIPYISSFDQNFPGTVYLHSLAIALFGTSDTGIRLFDVIIEACFTGFLYRFWSRWFRKEVAALAAILYVLYYVSGGPSLYGKRDGYVMMLMLYAVHLLSDNFPRPAGKFLGALLAGFAVVLRPTSLLFLALFSAYLSLDAESGRPILRYFPRGVSYFLIGLIPIVGVLIYYATIPSGLEAFYVATIRFNLDVYTRISSMGSLGWEIARTGLMIPLAIYGAFSLQRQPKLLFKTTPSRRDTMLYVGLLGAALFIVLLMQKFIRYHFAPIFILLTPLSACGLLSATNSLPALLARHYVRILLVIACTLIGYNPLGPLGFVYGLLTHRNPVDAAYVIRNDDGFHDGERELKVREFLNRPENSTGEIEICSFDPRLRSHVDRTYAGIYASLYPLALRPASTNNNSYTDYQLKWRTAYMDSLQHVMPRFIILTRNTPFSNLHDVYKDLLHDLPGFDNLLSRHYTLDTVVGDFQIFQRRD